MEDKSKALTWMSPYCMEIKEGPSYLTLQYLSCVPMKFFKWDNLGYFNVFNQVQSDHCQVHHALKHTFLSEDCQNLILEQTTFHPVAKLRPPSVKYQKIFLKILLDKVEFNGHSPTEDLCNTYLTVMNAEMQPVAYKTYYVNKKFLTILENANMLSGGTTGLVLWTASFCLAEWMLQHQNVVKDCSIMELGCGCGFTGLSICKNIPVKSYMFTDCNEEVISYARHNIQVNDIKQDIVSTQILSWGDESSYSENNFDVILGADLAFDKKAIVQLVKTLQHYLHKRKSTKAYIASTVRNDATYAFFTETLQTSGLRYDVVVNVKYTPESFIFNVLNPSLGGCIQIIEITS